MSRKANSPQTSLICVLLAAAILVSFWPVIFNGFIDYDDQDYVTENSPVRAGLTFTGLIWAFTTGWAANWHPLTWVSHMVDVQLFGLNASLHHASNLVLHIINTLLLFLILKQITGSKCRSSIV